MSLPSLGQAIGAPEELSYYIGMANGGIDEGIGIIKEARDIGEITRGSSLLITSLS